MRGTRLRSVLVGATLAACGSATGPAHDDLEGRARDIAASYVERFPLPGGPWDGIGTATRQRQLFAAEERRLLAATPDAAVLRELGSLYTQVEEHARGMAFLLAALAETPDEPRIWLWLGANRLSGGELLEAETCLRFAERLEPRDPRMPRYLGEVYKVTGDRAAALAAFERALAIEPGYVEALWGRAALLAEGDPAAPAESAEPAVALGTGMNAQRAIEELLAVDPDHPSGLWLLARLLEERGDVRDAQRVLDLRARHERATLLDDLGLRDAGGATLVQAVQLGIHYLWIGAAAEAEREFRTVLGTQPREAAVRANALAGLAESLLLQGQATDEVTTLLARLEQLWPDHPRLALLVKQARERGLR